MNQRVILLTAALVPIVIYGQQRTGTGQTPPPLPISIPGESEIQRKLETLHDRISPVYSDPTAKAKVMDDFIAAEGPGLYQELIDRMKVGFYSRNELRQVADVMERIKPGPTDKLIAQIQEESDPNIKAMLIYCLGRFDGVGVRAALRGALEDTRLIIHPYRSFESAPWPVGRVSDEAYLALLPKVQKQEGIKVATPIPAWKLPQDDKARERRNDDLKMQLDALHN